MLRGVYRTILNSAIAREQLLKQCAKYPLYISKANLPSKTPFDHEETDEEFDIRMECYFTRGDIDGWELRKGLNDLAGIDAVPEPKVILAALYAARRVNDYAVTTRFLEMVEMKCGNQRDKIWPYIMQEIKPALDELGIDTPEQMGYAKPELALVDIDEVNEYD